MKLLMAGLFLYLNNILGSLNQRRKKRKGIKPQVQMARVLKMSTKPHLCKSMLLE